MGSSKKPKKKKPEKHEVEPGHALVDRGTAAAGLRSSRDVESSVRLEELERAVGQIAERLTLVEHQLERTLGLHRRTNTLLELLAGSAFDFELGAQPRR